MTPAEFFQTMREHVDAATPSHVAVHLGEAPPYVAGEMVHPYLIIWPTPGTALDDRLVDGRMGPEATELSFQVTSGGPDAMTVLHVTSDMMAALQDTVLGGSIIRADVIVNRDVRPLPDETVRPVRYFLATTWQTTLTRSTTNA